MRLSKESTSRFLPGGRHDATYLLGEAARLAIILSCSALVVRPGMRRIIAAARRFPAPDIAVVPGAGVSSAREQRHTGLFQRLRAQALRSPPAHPLLVLAPRARSHGARHVHGAGRSGTARNGRTEGTRNA